MAGTTSSTKNPPSQFFDNIVHPLDQGIRIPRHGKCLEDAVLLSVPDGIQWKVELQVINGDTWMKNGFQEFAEFYCVKKLNLLVFKYEGDSRFSVSIFDVTAAEIDYSFKLYPEFRPMKPQDPEFEHVTVGCEDVKDDNDDEVAHEDGNSVSVHEVSDDSFYEVSDHESGRRRENGSRNFRISYSFVNGRRLRKRSGRRDSGSSEGEAQSSRNFHR